MMRPLTSSPGSGTVQVFNNDSQTLTITGSATFNKLIIGIKIFYNGINNKEIGQIYHYNLNDNINRLSFNDGEVQKVKWMSENEIINSMHNNPELWSENEKGFTKIIKDLKNKL